MKRLIVDQDLQYTTEYLINGEYCSYSQDKKKNPVHNQ